VTAVSERIEAPAILEAPERRIEGADKVSGRARYAADLRRDDMLHAAILRSPFAHARIASIDLSAARALPGVRAAIAGADVRPARIGRRVQDWPVLAWDRVRFVGDRVAAVAADTREIADEALARIAVEYEELPTVFDPDAALAADAPLLHPDAAEEPVIGGARPAVPHPNAQGYALHEHGDVAAAFASAARVFEHVFDVPRVFQAFLEPRAALVWLEGETVRVITTNKAPFGLRDQMALTLGVPKERIVLETHSIGGDFGGKGLSPDEHVLYFLARASGRPVKIVSRYADEMRATNTRHAARIRLRTGVDAEGRIVAHDARVVFDGGAYAAGKPVATLLPGEALATLGGYRVPAARVEAISVYTNTVPAGHMRAPGQPQNTFAAESHVDLIAREMGIDPLEMRMRNAIHAGDVDIHGHEWHASAIPEVLETLRREMGPRTEGTGRGFALGARGTGRGKASVRLTVTPDAHVEIFTGVSDQGGGAHTMMQRVVAAELGIPAERVRLRRGPTDQTPFDPGVGGSRVTPVVGGATLIAARALGERLERIDPAGSALGRLERAATENMSVTGEIDLASSGHSSYAYAVDVRVDRETGVIRIADALLVADVGTVINPVALHGQLVGAYAYGLGQALFEEMRLEDGVVVNPNLSDYKLPTIADVPPVRVILVTDDKGPGPFGAKSVGELANPGIAPAIANAIDDAVGARVTSLPLAAEKILAAL
jgi:CO/xanthine dehydrogenase Mo-binding subunit